MSENGARIYDGLFDSDMQAAKEYGRKNGAAFVRTKVFPENEDGLRFYRKNGFAETMITIECPLD